MVCASILLILVLGISSVVWNVSREGEKDSVIRANLGTILTQAQIYKTEFGAFANSPGSDCSAGIFADPTVAAALVAIQLANNYSGISCGITPDSYVIAAARPNLGFFNPPSSYWCADDTHTVCTASDVRTVEQTGRCGCTKTP
jgi:hypothetical protein